MAASEQDKYLDQHCTLCGNKPIRYLKTLGGFHKVCDSCRGVLIRAGLDVEPDVIHATDACRASMEKEMREPLECGHPQMCWVSKSIPNAENTRDFGYDYCTVCREIAEREAAALRQGRSEVMALTDTYLLEVIGRVMNGPYSKENVQDILAGVLRQILNFERPADNEWLARRDAEKDKLIADLRARFSDLATEMEKHSNDHIHDEDTCDKLQAAVEGVCADRIKAILVDARTDGR